MADEVVKAPEVTPVEAPKATTEKKTTRGRKKGTASKAATAKKAETKTAEKKPGRKSAVKKVADKKPKASTKSAPVQNFVFGKPVFQLKDKEVSEDLINKKVLDYLSMHPYIHAEKIETFVNLEEEKVYFTVDGFGNPDFSVSLWLMTYEKPEKK